jgi:thiamine-phosphate pyrophosphorylase
MFSWDRRQLYTFVDSAYLNGRDPLQITRELCRGGSDIIQFRAKDWPRETIRKTASEFVSICRNEGVLSVINDFPDIAQEYGADLCHLGQEDFFDCGFSKKEQAVSSTSTGLGLSSHAPEQANRAINSGADYIAIGPVFATPTKPTAKAVTLEYVRWAASEVQLPWFAIGGIHLGNLDEVLAAGARRICVVSCVLKAPDVARACQAFKQRLISVPL